MITIKKYSNRRLYDTSRSQYVTLEELAEHIRQGEDVQVLDAKTSEDLTQAVLAQIIMESRGAARLLPASMLTQLIRMEEDLLAEFFGHYMAWALSFYLKARRSTQRIKAFNALGGATPGSSFGAPNGAFGQWLQAMYGWAPPSAPNAAPWGQQPPPPYGASGVPMPPPFFDEEEDEEGFGEGEGWPPVAPPEPRRARQASAHGEGESRARPNKEAGAQGEGGESEVTRMRQELDEIKALLRAAITPPSQGDQE